MRAFEEIYERYFHKVYHFLLRMTGDAGQAEDLTQETFLRALAKGGSFEEKCSVDTWLCSIAKNLYFSSLRKHRARPAELQDGADGTSVEELLMDKERRTEVFAIFHEIPEPFKEVLTLRIYGGLSHGEIGALFGKTESWSRVTFYRAKVLMTEKLREAKEYDKDGM